MPLVGHALAFLHDKLGFLARCAAEYGDVVRLEIGARTYLVSGPEDVKHVLVTHASNYEKTPRLTEARGRRFFGAGLVTARGQPHLRQRRMLQPVFHRGAIDRFARVMSDISEEMLEQWQGGAVIDVHQQMLDVTQRMIVRLLLGSEPEAELARLRNAVSVRRRYQEYLLGSVLPFASRLPTRLQREHTRADREIDDIVYAALRRRRDGSVTGEDLLQMLVRATYDDGSGMNDDQIRDEFRTLVIAGYETVAEALTWAFYLLGSHPEADSAVAAEVSAVPAKASFSIAMLDALPVCRMVLAEAMRLYPPTWLFVRVAQEPDTLPSGVRVPAGSKIYLSQWVMHRNPRYFPDPERFDPSRFTDAAIRSRPRFTYLPFGAGRRLCIGEEFAWMQAMIVMASIARRYRLLPVPGHTVVPEPNVTLRPRGGLPMQLCRR